MVFPLGALIGAAGSLGAGFFGASAAKSGAKKAAKSQLKASMKNLKYQKMFARQGIQWRVRDARKAGIHPLAALGAATTSFSPSFIGAGDGGEAAAGAALAQGIAGMGQGVGRAVEAYQDESTRAINNLYLAKMQSLQMQNMELQNAELASRVANLNQPGRPPAFPSGRYVVDGQGSTQLPSYGAVVDQPLKRVSSSDGFSEPGAVTDVGWLATAQGGRAPVMSTDAKERLEEDWIGGLTWNLRNRVLQNLQLYLAPPPDMKGAWYNPVDQAYHRGNDRADKSGAWFKKNSKGEWDFNF